MLKFSVYSKKKFQLKLKIYILLLIITILLFLILNTAEKMGNKNPVVIRSLNLFRKSTQAYSYTCRLKYILYYYNIYTYISDEQY